MGDQHTKGPWAWMGNGPHDIYLATTHSGRQYVMGFRRMGPQGAQPVFRVNSRMVPARDLLQFEVGDRSVVGLDAARADASVYRYDIRGVAQADANLIAAAPTMFEYIASSASAGCATARKIVDEIAKATSPALPEPTEGKLK